MERKKILIVDDNKLILSILKEKFELANCQSEILTATTYKDGMNHILENKDNIHAAIIDLNLPNVEQGEMAKYTVKKDIPTIVFTGVFDEVLKQKLLDNDIVDFIQKDSKNSMDNAIESIKRIIHNYDTNILIVDDSKVQLALLKNILESVKLNVLTAHDGNEALELVRDKNNKISIVLTDYNMPKMDGMELTIAIRELYDTNELGIIALSSTEELDISSKFIKIGANDYINKPYQKISVISRIHSLLHNIDLFNESKKREQKLQDYVTLVDQNVITSSTDLKGNITYVSEAFCEISGYEKDELLGKSHRIVKHQDMADEVYKELWSFISNNKTWKGEIKNKKKDGNYYWVKASISPIFDEDNKKIGYTAIRQDITDKKIIEKISITDGLTGIYNRRHFNDLFQKIINSLKRDNSLVSFLIMDIDHFKQYNDTYGHQMGDEVLIKVAAKIKNSLHRADDYCFRLGGEEFGVIFNSDSKEHAFKYAEVMRQNIENLCLEHKNNSASAYITASMGLVCKNANDIKGADEVYKLGDDLLYKSKESGRNKVSV